MKRRWPHECLNFLQHRRFTDRFLTTEQLEFARAIVQDGSTLEQHVLDWTLKMLVPFRAIMSSSHPDWLALTYEQIVRQPHEIVDMLAAILSFDTSEFMQRQVLLPSRTVTKSTSSRVDNSDYLLRRWRDQVPQTQERQLLRIPQYFRIDLYQVDLDDPSPAALDRMRDCVNCP